MSGVRGRRQAEDGWVRVRCKSSSGAGDLLKEIYLSTGRSDHRCDDQQPGRSSGALCRGTNRSGKCRASIRLVCCAMEVSFICGSYLHFLFPDAVMQYQQPPTKKAA